MDKIEELLFLYNSIKQVGEKTSKRMRLVLIPVCVYLVGWFVIEIVGYVTGNIIMMLVGTFVMIVFLYFWTSICEGTIGTKKWKQKMIKLRREQFKENQKILSDLVEEQGMNCQQVYNLLCKKVSWVPYREDKLVYIISLSTLVVSITNLFVTPLQDTSITNYSMYILLVFVFLLIGGVVAFLFYIFHYKSTEPWVKIFLRKNNYEYIIKLLEDMLN